MTIGYEINELVKEDSWRMFRILGELVEGFDELAGIEPAISIYGSARIREGDNLYAQTETIARQLGQKGFSIVTGGGPGVMEAANKGALESGAKSVGLNIELPEEQIPNPYTTKSITFHHFFVRKVMLVKYASAFIAMPGGLGTLDEVTEVLTLMQTHKIKPFPVVLFQGDYWNGFLEWLRGCALSSCSAQIGGGFISEGDFDLLRVCESPDEVVDAVWRWYDRHEIGGRKALDAR